MKSTHRYSESNIDIDLLIKEYFEVKVVYEYFAELDKGKIGFISNGIDPLRVYRNNHIQEVIFPKGYIVIEKFLLNPEENNRRRFTIAHELAHKLIDYYSEPEINTSRFCNSIDVERTYTKEELNKVMSITEVLANRLAAAILMPRFLVEKALNKYNHGKNIICYDPGIFRTCERDKIKIIAEELEVSYSAAFNRLRELNLIDCYVINKFVKEFKEKKVFYHEL